MDNSPNQLAVKAIIRTLKASAAVISALTDAGITRIFFERAPQEMPYPYVVIRHMSGGLRNHTKQQFFDGIYRITSWSNETGIYAVSAFVETALIDKPLVVTDLPITGMGLIQQTLPISNTYSRQNEIIYEDGADYRIRFSL
jgi:hypothetical protein